MEPIILAASAMDKLLDRLSPFALVWQPVKKKKNWIHTRFILLKIDLMLHSVGGGGGALSVSLFISIQIYSEYQEILLLGITYLFGTMS